MGRSGGQEEDSLGKLGLGHFTLFEGGLNIKNVADFNLALLNKGGWRILQGQEALWYDILKARNGDLSTIVLCEGVSNNSSFFWWRDLLKIRINVSLDLIVSFCGFKVGNGFNTHFWEANWLEDSILKDVYLDLYLASSLNKVSVAGIWGWCVGVWVWSNVGIPLEVLEGPDIMPLFGVAGSVGAFWGVWQM